MTVTESTPLVYDPFSWEIQHNPYPTYTRLREEAPVYHNEAHGFWALSRHADVLAASLAPSTFVSSRGVTLEGVEQGQPLLILKDPPEHEWHRKVVSRVFTPKYVAGLEPYIRQVACELLDGLRGPRVLRRDRGVLGAAAPAGGGRAPRHPRGPAHADPRGLRPSRRPQRGRHRRPTMPSPRRSSSAC